MDIAYEDSLGPVMTSPSSRVRTDQEAGLSAKKSDSSPSTFSRDVVQASGIVRHVRANSYGVSKLPCEIEGLGAVVDMIGCGGGGGYYGALEDLYVCRIR